VVPFFRQVPLYRVAPKETPVAHHFRVVVGR